jgi:hypothetical protein
LDLHHPPSQWAVSSLSSFSHTISTLHSWPRLSIDCSPKPCRTPPSWGKVNSPQRTSE